MYNGFTPKRSRETNRLRRRRSQIALPDRSVIELNDHAVRRIDGALAPGIDPDPGRRREPVGPCAGGLAGFVEQIQIGSVLGDEGGIARQTLPAGFDAFIGAGQIDRLRRCVGCGQHGQDGNGG